MISLSFDTSGEATKSLATVQLALAVLLGDVSAAVAVLGVLAVLLGQRDLLALFLVINPLSIVGDVFWLASSHHRALTVVMTVAGMVLKLASSYYAFDLYTSTQGGAGGGVSEYAPFSSPARPDPFSRVGPAAHIGYAPPAAAAQQYQPPAQQAPQAAQQYSPPQPRQQPQPAAPPSQGQTDLL